MDGVYRSSFDSDRDSKTIGWAGSEFRINSSSNLTFKLLFFLNKCSKNYHTNIYSAVTSYLRLMIYFN